MVGTNLALKFSQMVCANLGQVSQMVCANLVVKFLRWFVALCLSCGKVFQMDCAHLVVKCLTKIEITYLDVSSWNIQDSISSKFGPLLVTPKKD